MAIPESVSESKRWGERGFSRSDHNSKSGGTESKLWEDESLNKYLRLSRKPAPSTSEPQKIDAKKENEEIKQPKIPEKVERKKEAPEKPIPPDEGLFILTDLPNDMNGIATVMFLIEFIKKRVGTDGIISILNHYRDLGWFNQIVLEKLLNYSKMIFGDLGFFECETEDDVPTTTSLHHAKVLEIIFMIKNRVDISITKDFSTYKLHQHFHEFTERGVAE
ncbi:MAG: FlaD/FlaE family flagellar protein [Candidatus Thermoplasmatota archaeon]|jgi:archaellum component FlaD/FlaE|nr:FlaD/FlaE family flagellar protein [Candidatus Thermoplasmatota archaeon]